MKEFTDMELKNMVIEDVTGCSEHAKGRIGRILQAIRVQDGEAFMMYPKQTDGKQPFFRLTDVKARKKWVSGKIVITSSTGTYTVRPASAQELQSVARQEYAKVISALERVYGPDVHYMAPEQAFALAGQLSIGQ